MKAKTWPCGHPKHEDLHDETFPCPEPRCSPDDFHVTRGISEEEADAILSGQAAYPDEGTTRTIRWKRRLGPGGWRWEWEQEL